METGTKNMATAKKQQENTTHGIGGEAPTNDSEAGVLLGAPYVASVEIEGVCPIIFHRFPVDEVARQNDEKTPARKGGRGKKHDNPELSVYRNDENEICIPGEYLKQACVQAGRFRQDPRSPRKSAMDLYKALIIPLTELASLGTEKWDYLDRRRCVIQRAGICRTRPAFQAGWKATFQIMIQIPDYLSEQSLNSLLVDAGRLIGLGDFRPTYGRFNVTKFEVQKQ